MEIYMYKLHVAFIYVYINIDLLSLLEMSYGASARRHRSPREWTGRLDAWTRRLRFNGIVI